MKIEKRCDNCKNFKISIEHEPCCFCGNLSQWTPTGRESRQVEPMTDHSGEVNEMISKAHEAMEGRYIISGDDLLTIHWLLCQMQNHFPDTGKKADHSDEVLEKVMSADEWIDGMGTSLTLAKTMEDYAAYVAEIKEKEAFKAGWETRKKYHEDQCFNQWKEESK